MGIQSLLGEVKYGKSRYVTSANITNNTQTTLVDITGKPGRVDLLSITGASNGSLSQTYDLIVTIDGKTETHSFSRSSTAGGFYFYTGSPKDGIPSVDTAHVRDGSPSTFNNQCKVEFKKSDATIGSVSSEIIYRLEIGTA